MYSRSLKPAVIALGARRLAMLPGLAVLLVAATCLTPVCARAQTEIESREGIALQNQLLELRQDLMQLQDKLKAGMPPVPGAPIQLAPPPTGDSGGGDLAAKLLARVQAMEDEIRQLRGKIDETANQNQRQFQDLSKQIADLRARDAAAPGGSPPTPSPVPPTAAATPPPPDTTTANPTPTPDTPPPLPPATPGVPRTPERALAEGNNALARHDYSTAEAAAREVLQGSRISPRAYDAQYLLAQALAGEHSWAQAAIAYDDAYSRAKTGRHAQDALIGLASALESINESKAACDTLTKLNHDFSTPRPDIKDQAQKLHQQAGCS